MAPNVMVLGLGAVLLLVGIVGGGFELKEFKIPKVGPFARILAAVAGSVFILVGLRLGTGSEPGPANGSSAQPAEFTITDHLGEGQITEQVTILIDGKFAGQLTVDGHNPQTTIPINLSSAGLHSYTIESRTTVKVEGTFHDYQGAGQGMIDVQAGKHFEVEGSITGDTWLVTLAEVPEDGVTASR